MSAWTNELSKIFNIESSWRNEEETANDSDCQPLPTPCVLWLRASEIRWNENFLLSWLTDVSIWRRVFGAPYQGDGQASRSTCLWRRWPLACWSDATRASQISQEILSWDLIARDRHDSKFRPMALDHASQAVSLLRVSAKTARAKPSEQDEFDKQHNWTTLGWTSNVSCEIESGTDLPTFCWSPYVLLPPAHPSFG